MRHVSFFLEHRPIGVARLDYPMELPIGSRREEDAAALAAGCAAVWKPSELTR